MCKLQDVSAYLLQVGLMLLSLIDFLVKRGIFDERLPLQAASDPPPPPQGGDPDEIEPEPDPAPVP